MSESELEPAMVDYPEKKKKKRKRETSDSDFDEEFDEYRWVVIFFVYFLLCSLYVLCIYMSRGREKG